jgi:hypothetical protein
MFAFSDNSFCRFFWRFEYSQICFKKGKRMKKRNGSLNLKYSICKRVTKIEKKRMREELLLFIYRRVVNVVYHFEGWGG